MIGNTWWMHLLWILVAGLIGFGITAIFAGWLQLKRTWLVLVYVLIAGAFLYAYFRWSQIDLTEELRQRWWLGLAGAVIVGFLMVRNVLAQPSSPRSHGAQLVFDLLWSGAVYGILDGLFLSVMPLLATWQAFSRLDWAGSWLGTLGAALVGLLASSYVTTAYHLGYPEFRGIEVAKPVLGNDIMSLGYILTQNPLSAALSHAAMHVAAVLHGMEATIQLPPHY
jgi:hypothetical protein